MVRAYKCYTLSAVMPRFALGHPERYLCRDTQTNHPPKSPHEQGWKEFECSGLDEELPGQEIYEGVPIKTLYDFSS